MGLQVLQRADWRDPFKQGETFRLTKAAKETTCDLWTHPLGWSCV